MCVCRGEVQVMKKTHCGRNSCLSGGIRRLISFGEEAELKAETRRLWPLKVVVCLLLAKSNQISFPLGLKKKINFHLPLRSDSHPSNSSRKTSNDSPSF